MSLARSGVVKLQKMTASAWPNNATGENHHQVPTELCYVPGKQSYDWGYQIANGQADRLQWFKLLLQHPDGVPDTPIVPLPTSSILGESLCNLSIDDTEPREDSDARLPEFEPPAVTPAVRASKRLTELGIEPVTVVEDFLKGVRQVTLDAIRNTFGKEMVEMNDLEWILSVPAIWSDSAKDLMVKAARGAGFGRHWKDFYLVGEPEAAAAYTLKAIQSHGLKVRYIV